MEEQTKSTAGQGLGIAGFVLGLVALIISFIPCVGLWALIPGILGIVFSAIALSQTAGTNASKGLIIAGLVLSIIGTSIASVQFFTFRTASRADVGISTHKESEFGNLYFSNKLVEYLTQGLPVVASRTRTVVKYLPEDTVFYFEPENFEHCAQQLIIVWRNHNLVKEKLRNSKKILHRLNWQTEKERLVSIYMKLLT